MEGKQTKPNKYQRNVNEASDFDPKNLPLYRNLYMPNVNREESFAPLRLIKTRENQPENTIFICILFGSM